MSAAGYGKVIKFDGLRAGSAIVIPGIGKVTVARVCGRKVMLNVVLERLVARVDRAIDLPAESEGVIMDG